jgi:hypothetical protein
LERELGLDDKAANPIAAELNWEFSRAILEAASKKPVTSSHNPAPQSDHIEWTTVDTPARWAKLFGISRDSLIRRFEDGSIRHKKLSPKSYQVAIDDLPAKHQAKFRNSGT